MSSGSMRSAGTKGGRIWWTSTFTEPVHIENHKKNAPQLAVSHHQPKLYTKSYGVGGRPASIQCSAEMSSIAGVRLFCPPYLA